MLPPSKQVRGRRKAAPFKWAKEQYNKKEKEKS